MTTPEKNKPDDYLTITQSPVSELCVTPRKRDLDDIEHLSTPQLSSSLKRRKRINTDTIGILSRSHFCTPKRTKTNIEMIKNKVQRFSVELKTYNELIEKLQHKILLSKNASYRLQILWILCYLFTPDCTKSNLQMIKNKCKEKQIQIHNLQKDFQRHSVQLKTFNECIEKLQHKILLSENAS